MKIRSRVRWIGALFVTAAMGAAGGGAIAITPAAAAVAAATSAFTVVAPSGSTVPSMSAASPTVEQTGSGGLRWRSGSSWAEIIPIPSGAPLTTGTHSTQTAVDLGVSNGSSVCRPDATGRVTIHEITYDGATITSLAATWGGPCSGAGASAGELRFNSSRTWSALGNTPLGKDAAKRQVTFTATDAATVARLDWDGDLGGDVTDTTCQGASLTAGASCSISYLPRAQEADSEYLVLTLRDAAGKAIDSASFTALGVESPEGAYTPLATPRRLLDTRSNNTPLRGGSSRDVKVTGANGVPSAGVSAVVVNVTVISPSASGNLKVYPAGINPPNTSAVNYNAGWTGANLVTVRPGTGAVDGKIRLLTSGGTTHAIVDIVGFYRNAAGTTSTPGAYGSYHPIEPYRLYDSRLDVKVNGYEIFDLWVDHGTDINNRTKALAVNVTVVGPERAGYVTLWNGANGSGPPATSTLNFTTGRVVPNMTIVPTTLCDCGSADGLPKPAFTFGNGSSGKLHVIFDVVGIYDDNSLDDGSRIKPLSTPTRVLDTRSGLGFPRLAAQATGTGDVGSLAGAWTTAIAGNLTAAAPSAATALSIWAADEDRPGVSSMNPYAGQYVSAMVMPGVSPEGQYKVFNGGNGTTNAILDVGGTFEYYRDANLTPASGSFAWGVGARQSTASLSSPGATAAPGRTVSQNERGGQAVTDRKVSTRSAR